MAIRCESCGRELGGIVCVKCGNVSTTPYSCSHCGNVFARTLCSDCGQGLAAPYTGPSASSEMWQGCRKAAIIVPIVLILFIILLIALGGI